MSRGDTNNSPGNVMAQSDGSYYPGQTGVDSGNFAIFSAPYKGIAAMVASFIVREYNNGNTTIQSLISAYEGGAGSGNDITTYVNTVCSDTGLGPNDTFSLTRSNLKSLVAAMVQMEGTTATGTPAAINAGINFANNELGIYMDPITTTAYALITVAALLLLLRALNVI